MKTLRSRVNQYFRKNKIKKTANGFAKMKAIFLIIAYLLAFISIFFSQTILQLYFCYSISGVLTIFVALNIAHDAAHSTFSKHKSINNFLLYTFDFLGASGYIWRLKHVHSHHPHVNIPNMDGDIKQSNLVRISPSSPFFSFHRYQYLNMPFLYLFYTLIWLMFRDFKDFLQTDISGKPSVKHPKI
ncbi:MAG: fatty acid desaturase [Saprospiraceae bacterium]|nr:fatty acid desaturase [Saprospiraceae bacterium]